MKGSISPLGKIESWQNSRLAWHSGIDFMVWQHHGVNLNSFQIVAVVAEYTRQLDPSDLCQLLQCEGWRPSAILVPESVSVSEVVELLANQTGEGGADHEINPRVPCKSGVLPRLDLTKWRDASFHSAPSSTFFNGFQGK